jgi:MFS family permease
LLETFSLRAASSTLLYRGRIDIIVNGSFWLGAAAGSGASLLFLDPHLLAPNLGWRLGFAVGGCLGLGILLLRRYVPESPRWLVTHGYERKAEDTMADIERRVSEDGGRQLPRPEGRLNVHPRKSFGFALTHTRCSANIASAARWHWRL